MITVLPNLIKKLLLRSITLTAKSSKKMKGDK